MDLAENAVIPAYKIGGVYLRFRREQILEYQKSHKTSSNKSQVPAGYSFRDKLSDFFYFNDFYILAVLITVLLLIIVFHGY
jgi:hypothetical protein